VIISPEFEEFVERLDREANEGFFHTAAQVAVSTADGMVLNAAVGSTHRGEPFSERTLSALYCTAKPVLAVGVLALIAADELSLDDRVGDVVDTALPDWIRERTIEHVLAHTAGFHEPSAVWSRIIPESQRLDWIRGFGPPVGWRFGVDRSYSEFAAWYILGLAIEDLSGTSFNEFVSTSVIEPYGISPEDLVLRMSGERADAQLARVSVTLDLAGQRPIPLLAEVGRDTAAEWNPSFGAYGTMAALAEFYRGILGDLGGSNAVLPSELIGSAVASRLPLTDDITLDRPAAFGLGFMTTLSSHAFGDGLGELSFGHAGQGGSCFAFADPERNVAVAVLCNAGLDADTALGYRRASLVDGILRAVDSL